MENAPVYAFSAKRPELAKRNILVAGIIKPHLPASGGQRRPTRKRLLALLTSIYGGAGNRIGAGTLFAAGALAGAAARAATEYRGAEDIARTAGLQDVLSSPNGAWALKELAIWQMVRSVLPGCLSVWRIILDGIIHDGASQIPNIDALCKATMDRRSKKDWGMAFIHPAHGTDEDAFSCVSKLWPVARIILKEEVKKGTAAFEVASAAQILLTKSKDAVALDIGASLVMQAAVMTATDEGVARKVTETGLLPG